MTSTYSYVNFTPTLTLDQTDGSTDLNIWDSDYKSIAWDVPTAHRLTVSAQWACNLPGIAAAYLGSRYLWWALAHYNGINDPIRDVVVGMSLRIPDKDALMRFMANQRSASVGTNFLPSVSTRII